MAKNKSEHILNTSSNLLGFCLVVLTSLKISQYNKISMIDEFTGVATILLISSCLFSFLSIRAKKESTSTRYEYFAENIFIIALLFVFSISFMVAFSIIF
jgi:F0F1-type ATP synthase assembly protein I